MRHEKWDGYMQNTADYQCGNQQMTQLQPLEVMYRDIHESCCSGSLRTRFDDITKRNYKFTKKKKRKDRKRTKHYEKPKTNQEISPIQTNVMAIKHVKKQEMKYKFDNFNL